MNPNTQQLDRVRRIRKGLSFDCHKRFVGCFYLLQVYRLKRTKISLFSKRKNAFGSSLDSISINSSNGKSGYATVFAIFFLTIINVPILCSHCARCHTNLFSRCFNLNFFLCLSFNHVILACTCYYVSLSQSKNLSTFPDAKLFQLNCFCAIG